MIRLTQTLIVNVQLYNIYIHLFLQFQKMTVAIIFHTMKVIFVHLDERNLEKHLLVWDKFW